MRREIDDITHMENNTPYNGWTNRATWNLMLWISNDESAYHFFRDLYRTIGGEVIEERIRAVRCDAYQWYGHTTPDGYSLSMVNWEEVVEHLDEDFEEIRREILA